MIPCVPLQRWKKLRYYVCGSNLRRYLPSNNKKDFFFHHHSSTTLNYKYLIHSGLKTFVVTSSTASSAPRYQQGACQRAASACVTSFFEVALHALKHHQEKEIKEGVFNLVRPLIFNDIYRTLQSIHTYYSPDTI